MRILLIEDDLAASRSVTLLLERERFSVDAAGSGEEGLDLSRVYDYDAVILDLDLPDMSGHEVLRRLRRAKTHAPLVILSGYADVTNKVRGLMTGADDYMTKPFARDELLARLKAVIRRAHGYSAPSVRTGRLVVDLARREAEVDGAPIRLTRKEYQILEILCLRKGATLTKELLLEHLYAGMDEPVIKIIDVFVCKLRKKIALMTGGAHYIETVWGRGYVLRDPAEKSAEKSNVTPMRQRLKSPSPPHPPRRQRPPRPPRPARSARRAP